MKTTHPLPTLISGSLTRQQVEQDKQEANIFILLLK